uniref:Uncharacterized protein n=1 Tax=Anguilla anguilla TaxID=7936 RepID=A0A0E9THR0_ANGAN
MICTSTSALRALAQS